ncbi:hypothetical protein A2U01_0033818, partial [Trifolium medium]|nr:hypothetical protein [Trifolium medium]
GLGRLEAIVLDRTPNPGIIFITNAIPGTIPTTRAIMLQGAGTGRVTIENGNRGFAAMNTTSKACDLAGKESIFLVAMDTASKDGGTTLSRLVQINGGMRSVLIEGGLMVVEAVIAQTELVSVSGRKTVMCLMEVISKEQIRTNTCKEQIRTNTCKEQI